jgi:ferric-dicitrate binding protein FerR (iron transport regulator)
MIALLAALLLSADPAAGAKVTILQGTLEAKIGAAENFAPVKAGDQIECPLTLKTGAGAKALLELPDGCELRVNEQTEITLETPRKFVLKIGRVFLKVSAPAAPVDFATELHPMKLEACSADISYAPRVPNGSPAATKFMVLDGKMQAFTKKFSPVISAGWWATGYGQQLNTPDTINNGSMDTAWVHSLLAERGRADEETSTRTEELLSILAKQPENDPAEAALRSLGELAAPGIARYLGKNVLLETQVLRRKAAARAIADAATVKSAGLLAGLLSHGEAQVRVLIAGGLARIAGKDLGFKEDYWKGSSVDAGKKAWEDWVKQNVK